jgi:hypothetical protein
MKSCLVAIAKNEGHYIFEWLLYHSFMGIDAAVVYDNNSTDDTVAQINAASRFVDVCCIDWPLYPGHKEAYNDAITRFRNTYDVFCMIDIDEFIVPIKYDSIKEILALTEKYPFIALNWVMYGSSGHIKRPAGLVLESYTWRAKKANRHIKSIIRPNDADVKFIGSVHYVEPADYVDLSGQPLVWCPIKKGKTVKPVCVDIAHINHYYTKSQEDFEVKMARGRSDTPVMRKDNFADVDQNQIHEPVVMEKYGHIINKIKNCMKDRGTA